MAIGNWPAAQSSYLQSGKPWTVVRTRCRPLGDPRKMLGDPRKIRGHPSEIPAWPKGRNRL